MSVIYKDGCLEKSNDIESNKIESGSVDLISTDLPLKGYENETIKIEQDENCFNAAKEKIIKCRIIHFF